MVAMLSPARRKVKTKHRNKEEYAGKMMTLLTSN